MPLKSTKKTPGQLAATLRHLYADTVRPEDRVQELIEAAEFIESAILAGTTRLAPDPAAGPDILQRLAVLEGAKLAHADQISLLWQQRNKLREDVERLLDAVPQAAKRQPETRAVNFSDGSSAIVRAEEAVLGNVVALPDGRRRQIVSIP